MRRGLVIAAASAVLGAGSAGAATLDREQHDFNAADQAAARTAVLEKADLGTGWTGGKKTPDLSPPLTCANYDPKQSDLVLTGVAETDWKHAGLEIDTEAQVLQTAGMVKLDWQRTVVDPHAASCMKEQLVKTVAKTSNVKLLGFKQISFPHVGTYSRAYLTTIQVTANGKSVPLVVEDVVIGSKRTELTIESTTAKVEQAAVHAVDVRLAKILVARAGA